jgi:hypothetical protein
MLTIKDMIKGRAKFSHFKDGELWYKTEIGDFEFPIPISDTSGATFLAEDKAIFFMRWIRKHAKTITDSLDEQYKLVVDNTIR